MKTIAQTIREAGHPQLPWNKIKKNFNLNLTMKDICTMGKMGIEQNGCWFYPHQYGRIVIVSDGTGRAYLG